MAAMPTIKLSEDEYLAMEAQSDVKHEFYSGEVFAMSGASFDHNRIVGNTYASLHNRSCEVFPSDIRLNISATRLYTYPDVVVVCDEPERIPNKPDTLLKCFPHQLKPITGE